MKRNISGLVLAASLLSADVGLSAGMGFGGDLGQARAAGIAPNLVPEFGAQNIFSLVAYPHALCNDGTAGAYYFRKSPTASKVWLFYLEGGGDCIDVGTCKKARSDNYYFTTSTGWNGKSSQGVLSQNPATNPTFYDANIVKVHYCSQDDWSGDKVPTTAFLANNADTGWWFEGRAIAVAAIQDLAARDIATGFSTASDILFTGSSAGGLGIVFTVNDLLPFAPRGARALLAVDAAFTLQIGTFDRRSPPNYMTSYNPYDSDVTAGMSLWNGHGDANCAAASVTQPDRRACYDTSNVLDGDYIHIPAFIAQSELDQDQLQRHRWHGTVDQDTQHRVYATEFADQTHTLLQVGYPRNVAYALQRVTHTLFVTDAQYTYPESFPEGTLTPQAALSRWFALTDQAVDEYGNGAGLP